MPLDVDEQEDFSCPRQPLMDDPLYWKEVFKYYGMFKKGFLPQEGSIIDQSNKAVEMFAELDQVGDECQEQLDEERSRKKGDPAGHGS